MLTAGAPGMLCLVYGIEWVDFFAEPNATAPPSTANVPIDTLLSPGPYRYNMPTEWMVTINSAREAFFLPSFFFLSWLSAEFVNTLQLNFQKLLGGNRLDFVRLCMSLENAKLREHQFILWAIISAALSLSLH